MKKTVSLLLVALLASLQMRANNIPVTIIDGVSDSLVKARMESVISGILTEANAAQTVGRRLDFSAMGISDSNIKESLEMLWEYMPFKCVDEEIVCRAITTSQGYQVRNIPLSMKPTGKRESDEDDYHEVTIGFDRQGNVESFLLSIPDSLYLKIVNDRTEQDDLHHRLTMIDFLERYYTAFYQKDLHFFEQVLNEDVLFLTNETADLPDDGTSGSQKQSNKKQSFLRKLRQVFRHNNQMNVVIDEIEVERSPVKPNIYGLRLHLAWTNGLYHDSGHYFFLWDFKEENAPVIHIIAWQPDTESEDPLEEIFSLPHCFPDI